MLRTVNKVITFVQVIAILLYCMKVITEGHKMQSILFVCHFLGYFLCQLTLSAPQQIFHYKCLMQYLVCLGKAMLIKYAHLFVFI